MTRYSTYVEDEIASQIELISNIDSDELDVEDLFLICAED